MKITLHTGDFIMAISDADRLTNQSMREITLLTGDLIMPITLPNRDFDSVPDWTWTVGITGLARFLACLFRLALSRRCFAFMVVPQAIG